MYRIRLLSAQHSSSTPPQKMNRGRVNLKSSKVHGVQVITYDIRPDPDKKNFDPRQTFETYGMDRNGIYLLPRVQYSYGGCADSRALKLGHHMTFWGFVDDQPEGLYFRGIDLIPETLV